MPYDYYVDPDLDEDAIAIVPEGTRYLKLIEWEDQGETRNGDPKIKLKFQDTETRYHVNHWLSLIPKGNPGHGIAKKVLKTLAGKKLEGEQSIDFDSYIGKIIKADIAHDDSSGKTYANIIVSSLSSVQDGENVPAAEVLNEDIPF